MMDRLTRNSSEFGFYIGEDSFVTDSWKAFNESRWFEVCQGDAIDRLAEYEDTGLTPSEVSELRSANAEYQTAQSKLFAEYMALKEQVNCQNCQFSFKRQVGKEAAEE